jgi:hypothetical protein
MKQLSTFKSENATLLADLMPGPWDVLEYPPIKALMDQPDDAPLKKEDFDCFNQPEFREFIAHWRTTQYTKLGQRDFRVLPFPVDLEVSTFQYVEGIKLTEEQESHLSKVLELATCTYTCSADFCKMEALRDRVRS